MKNRNGKQEKIFSAYLSILCGATQIGQGIPSSEYKRTEAGMKKRKKKGKDTGTVSLVTGNFTIPRRFYGML